MKMTVKRTAITTGLTAVAMLALASAASAGPIIDGLVALLHGLNDGLGNTLGTGLLAGLAEALLGAGLPL
ncbi:hypothetical protein D5S17_26190 [Pseudonocardiaceae bacterium YIM PH 21723]|nr:hypothetical protein D5S17_26190 [Pseudonocardiaceae bacterium YIM PH 21723]